MNRRESYFFYLLFFLIFILNSCYTPTSGCLNIDATNFNAAADEACDDCCTFPQLQLNIFHSLDATGVLGQDTCVTHSADSVLTDNGIDLFQLRTVAFYLSDFQLVMPTGDVFEVEDTITLSIYDDLINLTSKDTTVKDDFVLIERGGFTYDVGEFRTSGTFSKIRFKVGIADELSTTNVDTLSATHPLSSDQEMHFGSRSQGFVLQNFLIDVDTSSGLDTTNYEISQVFTNTVPVELELNLTFQPGFDIEIPLKVNYSKWLQGINFATFTEAEIKNQIVSNTAEAFEIDD